MREIAALRAELARLDLGGFIVPIADPHHTEWIMPSASRLECLTGFTGSAGTAVVLLDQILFFTDGRYTAAAESQIRVQPLHVFNVRDRPFEATLAELLPSGFRLGYDPWLHTIADVERLQADAAGGRYRLISTTPNPVDAYCTLPEPTVVPATCHPLQFAGVSSVEKRRAVARTILATTSERLLLSTPESICWLFNMRGGDATDTPLVYAFALLQADASADLFMDLRKVTADLRGGLGIDVRIHPYESLTGALAVSGDGRLLALDPAATSHAVKDIATRAGWRIEHVPDPCALPKALKNDAEIDGARACHRREGALLCAFWSWLEDTAATRPVLESEVKAKIDALRATDSLFHGPSFQTISASGPNAALPHYHVSAATDRPLRVGEFLLLDSGGQYRDGTTDITRTFALGLPPMELRERYTLVLKAFIRAAAARFPRLTRGIQIDAIARELFWREGADFDHSLGHGVGSFLGVHEGPNRLRPNLTGLEPLRSRMITSIEPAFYELGQFGVRIENLALITEDPKAGEGVGKSAEWLCFEQLTLCPIDLCPALVDRLTERERKWLNEYHARVRRELSPLVNGRVLAWLQDRTSEVTGV